jgi:hypothetical protein
MWACRTDSEQILPPQHALVFRVALGCLADFIGWEEWAVPWESGLSAFDRLTAGQQQAVLATVGRALLQPQAPAPRVSAVLAAAVHTIYDTLLSLIETDILCEKSSLGLRQQVLAALEEMEYWSPVRAGRSAQEAPIEPLAPACDDREQWAYLIGVLREEVLEDEDYALEDNLIDLEPSTAAAVKRLLAIDRDYFVTVPEDPTPERLVELRQELLALRGDEPHSDPNSLPDAPEDDFDW